MSQNSPKVPFPWVAFISQPIGHPEVQLIINPAKFQKLYKIWFLENCLRHETRIKNLS